MISNMKPLLTH